LQKTMWEAEIGQQSPFIFQWLSHKKDGAINTDQNH